MCGNWNSLVLLVVRSNFRRAMASLGSLSRISYVVHSSNSDNKAYYNR